MNFTFTPKDGVELIQSDGDPTTVVKIKFDSEIMYIDDSGVTHSLTKANLLEMVDVRPLGGLDLVRSGGSVDMDELSVTHSGGKTIITINPPDNKLYAFEDRKSYDLSVENYVKKQDASKVAQSNSISSYLKVSKTDYQGNFWIVQGFVTSCDVEYGEPSAYAQNYDREDQPGFACGTDTLDLPDFPIKDLDDNIQLQIAAERANF